MERENKPGKLERFARISERAEWVIAAGALALGSMGVAVLSGLGAVFDRAAGDELERRRD